MRSRNVLDSASTNHHQLKHQCVINTAFITNPKCSTITAMVANSIAFCCNTEINSVTAKTTTHGHRLLFIFQMSFLAISPFFFRKQFLECKRLSLIQCDGAGLSTEKHKSFLYILQNFIAILRSKYQLPM